MKGTSTAFLATPVKVTKKNAGQFEEIAVIEEKGRNSGLHNFGFLAAGPVPGTLLQKKRLSFVPLVTQNFMYKWCGGHNCPALSRGRSKSATGLLKKKISLRLRRKGSSGKL